MGRNSTELAEGNFFGKIQALQYRQDGLRLVSLHAYSTNAPIEQVLVHWGTGTRSLLKIGPPKCVIYWAWNPEIQIEKDSPEPAARVWFRMERINPQGGIMLYWTLVFLVIALIAGVLGFTGVAVAAAGVAKLLFVVFLVLFVISLVTHLSRRGSV
jgi:uncharacterized membrane protein YtjA (UPF0391 family)